MSMALANVLKLMNNMAKWKKDKKIEKISEKRFKIIKDNILKYGWDGKWFIYSINDAGGKVGSSKSKEGKIFINPQSWAMISGIIDKDKYKYIMKNIEPKVDTEVGPVHNWPAFTKYNPNIGQLTATAPGFFTNGNVYCHAAAFKVAADYEAGRADKAFDTFIRILPSEDKSEPYAQANGYVGPSALRVKKNVSDDPWRTGTVAWNFLNLSDRLLGFRRTFEGVYFKPLLPSKWKKVKYIRPFRGAIFEVTIKRGMNKGVYYNKQKLEDNFLFFDKKKFIGKVIKIECII